MIKTNDKMNEAVKETLILRGDNMSLYALKRIEELEDQVKNNAKFIMKDLKWKEIQSNKVRVFQLDEEPEIVYLIKIRENEYMMVHEDGYDQNTGKVEFLNKAQVCDRLGDNAT